MNAIQKKTVLFVTPYFPPHGGGLEQYALSVAVRLQDLFGWRVVVVTSGDGKLDTKDTIEGIPVYRLSYSIRISNTPFGFGWYRKIRRIARIESVSLVNVHTPVPGIGEVAALALRKIPLVVTYHANSMRKGKFFPDLLVRAYESVPLRLLLRKASRIICSSDSVRTDFLHAYMFKSTTIEPGVDCDTFMPSSGSGKKTEIRLLFVAGLGRAELHKGLHELLHAFGKLEKKYDALRLLVVGDGDSRVEYGRLVQSMHLNEKVSFAGRLDGDALVRAYQSADMFVLPSRNDSSPMVVKEAMACGLPVISTNVGGIPDMIEDGRTGCLISPGDTDELLRTLDSLIGDEHTRRKLGSQGRHKALNEFPWESRVNAYDAILSDTLGEGKPLLVHVAAYYPPHLGGLERVAQITAQMLSSRGDRVMVLTSSIGAARGTERDGKLTVRRLASFEFAHTPVAPSLAYWLMRLPRRSVVHLHLSQAYWPEIVFFILRVRKMPYVVHFHLDVGPSGILGPLFLVYKRMLWGQLLRHADKVIVLSVSQAQLLVKKYRLTKERIECIPNGVTVPKPALHKTPNACLELLYVGRLARQKRVERLIKAMALLTIPARLTILGDGEDRAELEVLAKDSGADVSFLGHKSEKEVRDAYRMSDVLLISSEREGMSLAMLEAMASGLPVIGSNVIGIQELIADCGMLVDEPYADGFARAIESLHRDRELLAELSKRSYAKALQFAWPGIIERLGSLYREIPLRL